MTILSSTTFQYVQLPDPAGVLPWHALELAEAHVVLAARHTMGKMFVRENLKISVVLMRACDGAQVSVRV